MDTPKRPPTSGTRRGKGAGYGGPARGSDPNRKPSIQNRPAFTSDDNPLGKRGPWAERKAELAEKAMKVWEDVVDTSESESNRIAAADKIMDRVLGKPTQTIAGDADQPLETKLVITWGQSSSDE